MATGDLVLELLRRKRLDDAMQATERRIRELDERIEAATEAVDAGRISRPEPWPDDALGGE